MPVREPTAIFTHQRGTCAHLRVGGLIWRGLLFRHQAGHKVLVDSARGFGAAARFLQIRRRKMEQ